MSRFNEGDMVRIKGGDNDGEFGKVEFAHKSPGGHYIYEVTLKDGSNDLFECHELYYIDVNAIDSRFSKLTLFPELDEDKVEDKPRSKTAKELEDDRKLASHRTCKHENRYINKISANLAFWYCPDCKKDLGDV